MKNHIELFLVLSLLMIFRIVGHCQQILFYPVDISETLIEKEELESINVYSIQDDGTEKRLLSSHKIDRSLREIHSLHYPQKEDIDPLPYSSKFDEDWNLEVVNFYDSEGVLFRQEKFIYEDGNLVSKLEYQENRPASDDANKETVIDKKEYVYQYGDDHNEVIAITYYEGWERENLLYEERFGYEFDAEGQVVYKSFESNQASTTGFDLKGESYWNYRKNKVKHEYHSYRPDRKETAVKIYNDNLLVSYQYENYAAGRAYQLEYRPDGLVNRLVTTHKRDGKTSHQNKIYEYISR